MSKTICTDFTSELRVTAKAFGTYVRRVRYAVIALTAWIFLLHFRLLTALVPGIDTEHLISSSQHLYESWLGIGRQGLWFVKNLSGNEVFNPDFAVMLTLLLLVPVCLLLPFLGSLLYEKTNGYRGESWMVFLFGAVFSSHPILTEQLYFTLQSAEVVFSFLLLELSLLCAHLWAKGKNPLWLLSTVLLLLLPFSTYQAFVPLFIAGAVGMVLLQSLSADLTLKKQWHYLVRLILAFLGGFLLNQSISQLFFTNSSYLNEQFYWSKVGLLNGCVEILSHIRDACAGYGTFYFIEFGILCIVLLALMIRHCFRTRKASVILWQLFLLFAWFASPFYLSILLGIRPVIRAQLVLPLTTAGTAVLCVYLLLHGNLFRKNSAFRKLCAALLLLLCVSTVYKEAAVTARLYYADAIRAQADLALANSIQEEIQRFTGENNYDGVVVFLGRRETVKNASCIDGDIMGQSFFNWDVDVEPYYYFSSNRLVDFMNSLGASYQKPSPELIEQAVESMDSLPSYPAEGSLFWLGDAVVVKLSDK